MKTKMLFQLMLVILLASCKDSNDDVQPEKFQIQESLKGNWSNNFRTEEYYDDTNKIAYKDTTTTDVRFDFDGKQMKISHPGVEGGETLSYVIPDTSKTNYIVISQNGKVVNTYEIVTISDSKMQWKSVVDWAGYPDGNGGVKTSRKGVYTYDFKKL